MRIVLDTIVVLSALLWRGTPHQLLTAHADLIVSGDSDLLSIASFERIPIVTAAQVVQRIGR